MLIEPERNGQMPFLALLSNKQLRRGKTTLRVNVLEASFSCLILFGQLVVALAAHAQQEPPAEEMLDYYNKWLNEDVVYIITDEERAVFLGLTTDEEREQFIEQFWLRRDPDPTTAINEFKEEHYRRIAYANEKFTSGQPGWKTDRGRVYILHGPPDEIYSRPTGGAYQRPLHEGGGTTATYPFEIWRYNYIEGLGHNIELEFVDSTFSGKYELALRPEEKDALLYSIASGLTLAEEMGLAEKSQRPIFHQGNWQAAEYYPFQFQRAKDNPLRRWETYTFVQAPSKLKYPDLKEAVHVNISYTQLPFHCRFDYFYIDQQRVLAPLTIEIDNAELSFQNTSGRFESKMGLYAVVSDIRNRVLLEFDDDLVSSYDPVAFLDAERQSSVYQKVLPLEAGRRYKLDVVVKEFRTGKIGVQSVGLAVPKLPPAELGVSSVIVSDQFQRLPETPNTGEPPMFVLGDLWIVPSAGRKFPQGNPLAVYLHVYNFQLDQTTGSPDLEVTYRLFRDEVLVDQFIDTRGASIDYFSQDRVVLLQGLPTTQMGPGRYRLEITVRDRLTGRTTSAQTRFEVAPRAEATGTR